MAVIASEFGFTLESMDAMSLDDLFFWYELAVEKNKANHIRD